MKNWIACATLALCAPQAHAAPFVWLDTDRGPIVIELDQAKAPITSAHFAAVVDEGFYDGKIFHRSIPNFIVQVGGFDRNFNVSARNVLVQSERTNGLKHTPGTVAMALPSSASGPLYNNGSVDFFINTATNTNLDGDYTVFGKVVYGMPVVSAIGAAKTHLVPAQTNVPFNMGDVPLTPTVIKRAASSDGFPIMPLHTGSWYDPDNSGRGISLEISTVAGGDGTPIAIAYWYDYFEGRQVWMNGAATFEYGDSEVTIQLQITEGPEFGAAFDPDAVVSDPDFGTLTIRFSGCQQGTFDYQTGFGDGSMQLQRITIPEGDACTAN